MQNNMQASKSRCRVVHGSYFAYWYYDIYALPILLMLARGGSIASLKQWRAS